MSGAPGGAAPWIEVVEYTDPLCPWAWGSEPRFRVLHRMLAAAPVAVAHRRVFGILFDEDEAPAPDPAAETAWYARYVAGVSAHTGAPFAAELRWVAASSWPASLAVAAAERQGAEVAGRVLRRLRETVFVLGEPADSAERVRAALRGVPGLDLDRLAADAARPAVRDRVGRDRAETRRPVPEVVGLAAAGPHPGAAKETEDGHRYALPTLLFRGPAGRRAVPGWRPPAEYLAAVVEVCPGVVVPACPPLSADQLLERYRSLTAADLAAAGSAGEPLPRPAGALRVATGHGELLLHPGEAAGSLLVN